MKNVFGRVYFLLFVLLCHGIIMALRWIGWQSDLLYVFSEDMLYFLHTSKEDGFASLDEVYSQIMNDIYFDAIITFVLLICCLYPRLKRKCNDIEQKSVTRFSLFQVIWKTIFRRDNLLLLLLFCYVIVLIVRLVFWNIDWHYGTFNDIMTALSLNDGNGMESVRNLSSVIEHGVCSDAIITFVLFVVFFVHFSYLKIVNIRWFYQWLTRYLRKWQSRNESVDKKHKQPMFFLLFSHYL